ncbi:MAG: response regulator [Fimbriimonadaceae bacterium]|nr:response regulator [Fimbriimonadaceae bacterium]
MAEPTILVVDDESINRELLSHRLRREGYRVRTAVDGSSALAAVGEELPDLILLDVMMPGIDGFEVTRRLRQAVATRAIPIVLVTALADRESKLTGLQAGADDFLTKPFDPVELIARVRSLLRLRYFQSLSAQRELLDAAFTDLTAGILVAEPDGTVLALNKRGRHLLNVREEQAVGLNLTEHLDRFELSPPWDLGAPAGTAPAQFDIHRKTDPPLVIEARLSTISDPEGQLVYYALVLNDVTAERRSDRLRRDFFSLTAHKIRTPMTILRGLVELLDDEVGVGLATNLLPDLLPDLLDKLDEVTDITEDLLRHSNLAEFCSPAAAPQASLRQAVADALAHLTRSQAVAVPAVIYATTADRLPLAPADLLLLLRELLENVAKFGGSSVELTLQEVPSAAAVELLLRDNARGIPHEHFESIFRECFQVDPHFTGQVRGFGLGLSIARRVVTAYGGTIEVVASEPGRGSTFRLRLPQQPPGAPPAGPPT